MDNLPGISILLGSKLLPNEEQKLLWTGLLKELPVDMALNASNIRVELAGKNLKRLKFRSDFKVLLIDFEKQYCSGRLTIDEPATISDGSKDNNYVPLSDCEWLIEAKPGKSIHIEFTELEIDPSDKIYLFRGDKRRQRDLLATFSGDQLPPKMIIKHGQALLWFVSEKEGETQGFSANISWENVLESSDSD